MVYLIIIGVLILFVLGDISNTIAGRTVKPITGGQVFAGVMVVLVFTYPVVLVLPAALAYDALSTALTPAKGPNYIHDYERTYVNGRLSGCTLYADDVARMTEVAKRAYEEKWGHICRPAFTFVADNPNLIPEIKQ